MLTDPLNRRGFGWLSSASPDAFAAQTATAAQITAWRWRNATYLPFNGVFESDSGVVNGTYSYWGQEHLLGTVGQSPSSQAGVAASAIVAGLLANEVASGIQTGNVLTHAQTFVLAKSLMAGQALHRCRFPAGRKLLSRSG